MMLTVQRELLERNSNLKFWIWGHQGQAEFAYACGLSPCIRNRGALRSVFELGCAATRRADVRSMLFDSPTSAYFLSRMPPLDAIIDISGFGYSDVWGARAAKGGVIWARHCERWRKPYLCLPQAWGPFKNRAVGGHVTALCRLSSVMYARDAVSRKYLLELPGSREREIKLAPDIAFLFDGSSKDAGAEFLAGLGIAPGQAPIVALTPNMRVYQRTAGTGLANVYLQFMAQLARHCMKEWSAQILLLPHEIQIGNGTVRDDRYLCGLLHVALRSYGPCVRVVQPCLAETIWSLYPHVDLLIGSRFHSLVYALSAGIPVVAVGWAHKYRELLRSFDLDKFVMEHDQLDTSAALIMLNQVWASRAIVRDSICAGLPRIRNQVTAMFDDVLPLLVQTAVRPADAERLSVGESRRVNV